MNLAVIPARGGSKRIPRKNVKLFFGKPMIAWSIEAAIASRCFDKIIVSTDDEAIADVSRKWGAEVPFVRPSALADDYTGTTAVIAQAIDWHNRNGERAENVCCVYATAPFIEPRDVKKGLELLVNEKCDYVFCVTTYAFPIQRAVRITRTGRVAMIDPAHANTRSQDLDEAYHDAGQFYWGKEHAWLESKPIFGPQSVPIVLPRSRVQDIDSPEDWAHAEQMFRAMRSETN